MNTNCIECDNTDTHDEDCAIAQTEAKDKRIARLEAERQTWEHHWQMDKDALKLALVRLAKLEQFCWDAGIDPDTGAMDMKAVRSFANDTLTKRNAELEQDAARLDWLESRMHKRQAIGQSPSVFWDTYGTTLPIAAETLREAIDVAMNARDDD